MATLMPQHEAAKQAISPMQSRQFIFYALLALILVLPFITRVCADHNSATMKVINNISYVPGSKNKRHLLDLYLPADAQKSPVIIWIHGGAWITGDKLRTPATLFLRDGYAVASINYRLVDQAKFPAQIYDCKAAIRWLRAHAQEYKLDPDRIGVWGMSAGGHLAALLGTSGDVKELEGSEGNEAYSSKVQAVCDWCGPSDLLTIRAQSGPNCKLDHKSAKAPVTLLLGGKPQENKQLAIEASPVTFVSTDDPPFLIMHGDKDELVPLAQSEELYEKLHNAKVDSTLFVVKGGEHGFATPATFAMVEQFFEQHLKK